LLRPWLASAYNDQRQANAAWKDRIEALAAAMRLSHDQACTDTSRLFYLPRRPADGPVPETIVLEGVPCDIFALPSPPKSERSRNSGRRTPRSASDSGNNQIRRSARQGEVENLSFTDAETGEIIDLRHWAQTNGGQFEIVTALKARRPDLFIGKAVENKYHIRCVNEDAHTQGGADAATFVMNASHADNAGFVYHCRHAHCDDLDRLFFLRRMLELRWLTIAQINHPTFPAATSEEKSLEQQPSFDDCRAAAAALGQVSSVDAINQVLRIAATAQLDVLSSRRLMETIKRNTGIPFTALKSAMREAEKVVRGPGDDISLVVAKAALHRFWADGNHLIRAIDRAFWAYTGSHWVRITDEQVKADYWKSSKHWWILTSAISTPC
jgi:hypothetical protein